MSTVVVLGAGIAGMEAAIALRRKLGPEHRVAGLGAQLDWDAVPGAAEYGQIICRIDGARRMWDAVRRLEKGTAVLGVMRGIEVRLHTGIRRVEPGRVILADDTAIAADFIMLMPPYRGSRAMLDSPGLSDDRGFVRCDLYNSRRKWPRRTSPA